MKRDTERSSRAPRPRAPRIGARFRPTGPTGDRQIGERRRQLRRMRCLPDRDGDRLGRLGPAEPRARRRPPEQRNRLGGQRPIGAREPTRDLHQRGGDRGRIARTDAGHEPQQSEIGLGGRLVRQPGADRAGRTCRDAGQRRLPRRRRREGRIVADGVGQRLQRFGEPGCAARAIASRETIEPQGGVSRRLAVGRAGDGAAK